MSKKFAGLDGGNNSIVVSTEDAFGSKAIIIPTIVVPYEDYSFGKGKKKALIDSFDVEVVLNCDRGEDKTNLGRFLVGNKAPDVKKKVKLRNGAKKKLGDEELLVGMLTSLAYSGIYNDKTLEGSKSIDYNIVSGLPYRQYIEDFKEFEEELRGTHMIKFKGDYNMNVELRISNCKVECEGLYSLFYMLLDENGNFLYKPEEMVGKYVIVIDIGEFTTELMVGIFKEDKDGNVYFDFVGNLCNGWDLGVNISKQKLIDKLNRPPMNTEKNRHDIDVVMDSKLRRGKINLSDGKEYDIINDYKMYLEELAKEISDVVVNPLVAEGVRGNVLSLGLLGGGAIVADKALGMKLKDYLSKDLSIESENIEIPDNSTTANADSYLRRCGYIWTEEEDND